MINAQEIIDVIKENYESETKVSMNDYLQTDLKISSTNFGKLTSIKKSDWTEYSGWREVVSGDINDEMIDEIERMAEFTGDIYEVTYVKEDEYEDEDDDDDEEEAAV